MIVPKDIVEQKFWLECVALFYGILAVPVVIDKTACCPTCFIKAS